MLRQSIIESDNLLLQLKGNIASVFQEVMNHRLGQVLTIIDATISDSEQRKAIKDLIKDRFWQEEYYSDEIPQILEEFCEKLNIDLVTTDELYRELHGLPNRLGTRDVKTPRKEWFK